MYLAWRANSYNISVQNLKEEDRLGSLGICGRIIFK
jgi:hypothetical protein